MTDDSDLLKEEDKVNFLSFGQGLHPFADLSTMILDKMAPYTHSVSLFVPRSQFVSSAQAWSAFRVSSEFNARLFKDGTELFLHMAYKTPLDQSHPEGNYPKAIFYVEVVYGPNGKGPTGRDEPVGYGLHLITQCAQGDGARDNADDPDVLAEDNKESKQQQPPGGQKRKPSGRLIATPGDAIDSMLHYADLLRQGADRGKPAKKLSWSAFVDDLTPASYLSVFSQVTGHSELTSTYGSWVSRCMPRKETIGPTRQLNLTNPANIGTIELYCQAAARAGAHQDHCNPMNYIILAADGLRTGFRVPKPECAYRITKSCARPRLFLFSRFPENKLPKLVNRYNLPLLSALGASRGSDAEVKQAQETREHIEGMFAQFAQSAVASRKSVIAENRADYANVRRTAPIFLGRPDFEKSDKWPAMAAEYRARCASRFATLYHQDAKTSRSRIACMKYLADDVAKNKVPCVYTPAFISDLSMFGNMIMGMLCAFELVYGERVSHINMLTQYVTALDVWMRGFHVHVAMTGPAGVGKTRTMQIVQSMLVPGTMDILTKLLPAGNSGGGEEFSDMVYGVDETAAPLLSNPPGSGGGNLRDAKHNMQDSPDVANFKNMLTSEEKVLVQTTVIDGVRKTVNIRTDCNVVTIIAVNKVSMQAAVADRFCRQDYTAKTRGGKDLHETIQSATVIATDDAYLKHKERADRYFKLTQARFREVADRVSLDPSLMDSDYAQTLLSSILARAKKKYHVLEASNMRNFKRVMKVAMNLCIMEAIYVVFDSDRSVVRRGGPQNADVQSTYEFKSSDIEHVFPFLWVSPEHVIFALTMFTEMFKPSLETKVLQVFRKLYFKTERMRDKMGNETIYLKGFMENDPDDAHRYQQLTEHQNKVIELNKQRALLMMARGQESPSSVSSGKEEKDDEDDEKDDDIVEVVPRPADNVQQQLMAADVFEDGDPNILVTAQEMEDLETSMAGARLAAEAKKKKKKPEKEMRQTKLAPSSSSSSSSAPVPVPTSLGGSIGAGGPYDYRAPTRDTMSEQKRNQQIANAILAQMDNEKPTREYVENYIFNLSEIYVPKAGDSNHSIPVLKFRDDGTILLSEEFYNSAIATDGIERAISDVMQHKHTQEHTYLLGIPASGDMPYKLRTKTIRPVADPEQCVLPTGAQLDFLSNVTGLPDSWRSSIKGCPVMPNTSCYDPGVLRVMNAVCDGYFRSFDPNFQMPQNNDLSIPFLVMDQEPCRYYYNIFRRRHGYDARLMRGMPSGLFYERSREIDAIYNRIDPDGKKRVPLDRLFSDTPAEAIQSTAKDVSFSRMLASSSSSAYDDMDFDDDEKHDDDLSQPDVQRQISAPVQQVAQIMMDPVDFELVVNDVELRRMPPSPIKKLVDEDDDQDEDFMLHKSKRVKRTKPTVENNVD